MSDTIDNIKIADVNANPTELFNTQQIIDLIYPIGSIYRSLDAKFDPNTEFSGSTWEKLNEGIFLESTEDGNQVGNEVQAGVPNITGGCNAAGYVVQPMNGYGAFQSTYASGASYKNVTTWGANVSWNIDASRSSAVFKNNVKTVQPHSIRCFTWKRIK